MLDDEPPRLPELPSMPLSAKSTSDLKGKQPAHKSQMSDTFVVKSEENQIDAAAAKEAEMKKLLEEKIRALVRLHCFDLSLANGAKANRTRNS